MRRRNKAIDRWLRAIGGASSAARREALESIEREGADVFWGDSGRARVCRRQIDQVFVRIARAAQEDDDDDVRFQAAYLLGHWYELRAVRLLLRVVGAAGQTARVRGVAAEGVGERLQPDSALGARAGALRVEAVFVLRAALADAAPEVRFWSVRALGLLCAFEARSEIEALARHDTAISPHMWAVKDEAVDALAFWDTGTWPDRESSSSHG
jgi:HEAT repeat protein